MSFHAPLIVINTTNFIFLQYSHVLNMKFEVPSYKLLNLAIKPTYDRVRDYKKLKRHKNISFTHFCKYIHPHWSLLFIINIVEISFPL